MSHGKYRERERALDKTNNVALTGCYLRRDKRWETIMMAALINQYSVPHLGFTFTTEGRIDVAVVQQSALVACYLNRNGMMTRTPSGAGFTEHHSGPTSQGYTPPCLRYSISEGFCLSGTNALDATCFCNNIQTQRYYDDGLHTKFVQPVRINALPRKDSPGKQLINNAFLYQR